MKKCDDCRSPLCWQRGRCEKTLPFRPTSTFSSDGTSLNFHHEGDYKTYEEEHEEVVMRAYERQRNRFGIWASNQNKFVKTLEELNDWDSKTMERRYAKWMTKQMYNWDEAQRGGKGR